MQASPYESPFGVDGKVVLLTGAGRGIGRGIARVLAAGGASVAINAFSDHAAEPLVQSLQAQGHEALLVLGDLTKSSVADTIVARTIEHFGRIDVLINTLGDSISSPVVGDGEKQGMTDDDWQNIIDINLNHIFYCCRAAGRPMLEQGHGKVINIASFMSARGGAQTTAYTAAKSAVTGLTRALALEWAPAIQVNAIAPGIFPDEEAITPEALQARDEGAAERIPLLRVGRPREVGYLAQYLASAASDYMTGQTLYLDGGMTVK